MLSRDKRINDILENSARHLIPKPTRYAWQWADADRILPAGSYRQGPFDSSFTPWIREITERVDDHRHDQIIVCLASQMAKTDGINLNIIGHRMSDDPIPILYLGPTEKNVLSLSKDRVDKLISLVDALQESLEKGRANGRYEKFFSGIRLGLGWAGSATEVASHPVGIALVDEYDRMMVLKLDGDPFELAVARVTTFGIGKVVVTSTPTEGTITTYDPGTGLEHWQTGKDIVSPTWSLWQEGTRHEWAWPCPKCGEYHIPRQKYLWWPDRCTKAQAKEKARLICPKCRHHIENKDKKWMNSKALFVAPGQSINVYGELKGKEKPNPTASFWASGLCSPFSRNSFGSLASRMVAATQSGKISRKRTVINTGFGELFAPSLGIWDWTKVMGCAGDYSFGQIPDGYLYVVIGADVQEDRFEWVIRAFGESFESALIDRGETYVQTNKPVAYRQLAALEHRDFGELPLAGFGIDSGYRKDQVYDFVRQNPTLRVAMKGDGRAKRTWESRYQKDEDVYLCYFNPDDSKSWVHSKMGWPENEPGRWLVPKDIDEHYCKQIVGERRVKNAKGKAEWLVLGPNHKLDAEGIVYVVAQMVAPQFTRAAANPRQPTNAPVRRRQISRGVIW